MYLTECSSHSTMGHMHQWSVWTLLMTLYLYDVLRHWDPRALRAFLISRVCPLSLRRKLHVRPIMGRLGRPREMPREGARRPRRALFDVGLFG